MDDNIEDDNRDPSSAFPKKYHFDSSILFEPSVISPDIMQVSVSSRSLTIPSSTPVEGECYWLPENAQNDWAGKAHHIALFQHGIWHFTPPEKGWLIWIADESDFCIWDGHALVPTALKVNPVTQLKSCLRSGVESPQKAGTLQFKRR